MTELLIVGGLTIDRFADGRAAPGGSVLHAAQAAVAEGIRPTFLTVAGDEPEAMDGLRHLAKIGDVVHQASPTTVTYGHAEAAGRRVLTYLAGASPIAPPSRLDPPRIALLAPIADELQASVVTALRESLRPRLTVVLIQGWLRRLEIGKPVRPLPLDGLTRELWSVIAAADAVVVSSEDLAALPEDPSAQARAIRARLGPAPLLVLSLGEEGYVLDDPAADRVVATVPRVIEGVPLVGAGDIFGAALAIHLDRGAGPAAAAALAAERVIQVLEGRRD